MTENETPKKTSHDSLWRNVGILISGFSVIVLIIVMCWGSFGLLAIDRSLSTVVTDLSQKVDQSQDKVSASEKAVADLQLAINQQNTEIKNQGSILTDLQKSTHANKDIFLAAEAQYLVKLANNQLQFENNLSVAIKLLQSASQEITKISDPRIFSVREALTADLVALQAVPDLDVTGIYLRLSALNDQIDKLTMMVTFMKAEPQVAQTTQQNLSWWRRSLNSMSDALQRIVIVRKNQPNIPPFLTPEQQGFLYQNLHAEFEKSEWALLHRQPDIYQNSLKQAMNWITLYTVQDSPITKQLLADLQQLQKIDVRAAKLNVDRSLQAFQAYLNSAS